MKNAFKPTTILFPFQARTWISNVKWYGLFYVRWFEV